MSEFEGFLANQAVAYAGINEKTGLIVDGELGLARDVKGIGEDVGKGGYLVAWGFSDDVNERIGEQSQRLYAASGGKTLLFGPGNAHLTMFDHDVTDRPIDPTNPDHRAVLDELEAAVEAGLNPRTLGGAALYLGDRFKMTDTAGLYLGLPTEEMYEGREEVVLSAQNRGFTKVKGAWGHHMTTGRVTKAMPAPVPEEVANLLNGKVEPVDLGIVTPKYVDVGYLEASGKEFKYHRTERFSLKRMWKLGGFAATAAAPAE